MTPCPRCHRDTTDGLLCTDCTRTAEKAITQLTWLLPELETTITGQANTTRAVRHAPMPEEAWQQQAREARRQATEDAEQRAIPAMLRTRDQKISLPAHAIPLSLAAADLLAGTRLTVAWWVSQLAGVRVVAHPVLAEAAQPHAPRLIEGAPCPGHIHDRTPGGCAWRDCNRRLHCKHPTCAIIRAQRRNHGRPDPSTPALDWLHRHTDTLRRHEDAARIVDDLQRAAHDIEQAIDGSDPEIYAGQCDAPDVRARVDEASGILIEYDSTCGAHLFGRPGDAEVTCYACGYVYDISERRDRMLTDVRDLLERPARIAQALSSMDLPITAAKLDVWICRDRKMHERRQSRKDGLPLILADPVYDDDGKPLYRVGDVIDRIEGIRRSEDVA